MNESKPVNLSQASDLARTFGDENRLRLLALLAEEELSVAELTRITRLAQSRVSTHLARLKEAGLLADRRKATSTLYRLKNGSMPEAARRMLDLLRATADAALDDDRARLRDVIAERAGPEAPSWAESVAGAMDRHYSPGRTWEATAWGTLGLARLGHVLDIASGDGVIAQLLVPRARSVTCLDVSAKVAAAGRRRLAAYAPRVRFTQGDMHALPFRTASFDQVVLMHALTYAATPDAVLREAARVLRPGGTLVGATLKKHAHHADVEPYDHVWLGFDPSDLEARLRAAGFAVELCAVTSREPKKPHFEVITIHARIPHDPEAFHDRA
ncbi:MAG: metalloregulator ArsR/SmtB family transcription factor [Planctomycetes bacterium]|nr:metalloregulator ArsR/SmtB family transcription factor [Planctomycetota bacterium]MCC7172823.1 metalloregulator ArsR/SmtB family transcription factor [Planctomycetota bacterium]